jgi:hypothetical protein
LAIKIFKIPTRTLSTKTKKLKMSRAKSCDLCVRIKAKCEHAGDGTPCKRCARLGIAANCVPPLKKIRRADHQNAGLRGCSKRPRVGCSSGSAPHTPTSSAGDPARNPQEPPLTSQSIVHGVSAEYSFAGGVPKGLLRYWLLSYLRVRNAPLVTRTVTLSAICGYMYKSF